MSDIVTLNEPQDLKLPIYSTLKIGTFKNGDDEFTIVLGLDRELARQLRELSLDTNDEGIQNHTSDSTRFADERAYDEWYHKDRTPFALVETRSGMLAALVWFGPKPLGRKSLRYLNEQELREENSQKVSEWHTIVYRSYGIFRGRGLMTPFMKFVICEYTRFHPKAKLWAGISLDNPGSLALATKLGFKKSAEHHDEAKRWCALIRE